MENKPGKLLNTSNPPKAAKIIKKTTMCMKSFFLFVSKIDKRENKNIGNPIKEGMKEVNELLPDIIETSKPQAIKKIP